MNDTPSAGETRSTAATDERVHDDSPVPPGRPVRLVPTPPGFWRLMLGIIIALLGPFFGILIGSTLGHEEELSRMDPLYWGFFAGCVIGALAILMAASGGLRLFRHTRSLNQESAA